MVGAVDEVEVPAEREAPESPESPESPDVPETSEAPTKREAPKAPDLSNKINAPCDVPDRPDPPDAIGMNFTIIFTELAAAACGRLIPQQRRFY